jgi:DNA-binding MarR family transcriptional regulator
MKKNSVKVAAEMDVVDRIIDGWHRQMKDFDDLPLRVFGRMTRVNRLLELNLKSFFESRGLSISDYDLLASLYRRGAPYRAKPSDIAKNSLLTSAGVTLRVDRLVEGKYAERFHDKVDRRIVQVGLTAEGLKLIKSLATVHTKRERKMVEILSVDERRTLEKAFRKLESYLINSDWPQ